MESGKEGTIHIGQVLEYNQDPEYLRDLLLHKLTLEAQKQVAASPLSKRDTIRRLGTSATQFWRLLDQSNYRKSVDQLLSLLNVLDCDAELVVRAKSASRVPLGNHPRQMTVTCYLAAGSCASPTVWLGQRSTSSR